MNLAWYVNRLLAMSPGEVTARSVLSVRKRQWRRKSSWPSPKPNFQQVDRWHLDDVVEEANHETKALLDEAEHYLKGDYRLLNITFSEQVLDWHRDPQSAKRAPLDFSLDLDYRDAAKLGNVKNIWEKNRHHHLTALALAYALTKEERYAQEVSAQLRSWLAANPFLRGVNWASSLELGVRLLAWVWIERLLRGSSVHDGLFGSKGAMWPAVFGHQWLISQHYSHGSSANNHLIGEMAGLFMAATVWPHFPESKQWQDQSRASLEREIVKQTFPSGLNREHAFSYHIFSLEFFLLAGLEGERGGESFSVEYKALLRNMLEVIPALTDAGGNLPRYGDGDEGMALQLRPLSASRTDWLYGLGRKWLSARVPPSTPKPLASLVVWPAEGASAREPTIPGSLALEDAGLYVLSAWRGTAREIFCLADAGPLGFLSIAAHGHADALSFTLSIGGVPIVVDPGTYVYHGDPSKRAYFRSTKAHNTITVDNQDQSLAAGVFLWARHAKTSLLRWLPMPQGGELVAEHDGYMRLAGRPVHRRRLLMEGPRVSLADQLLGAGDHNIEFRLHFAPCCAVTLKDECCQVTWNGGEMTIHLDGRLSWRLARAEADAGWYSPAFNVKESSSTLVGSLEVRLPFEFDTRLEIVDEAP